ncbi:MULTISPECIES: LLM class flavin-dependent oxidoreductase [unclassified Streptomyces]|uniref:LLM class flavin-dependent oxidoreductase n=1 Tax=unclassified Streptomyces TaxID=2593676 RepID=UPI0001C18EA0|nr:MULTISPECIES: LLM class flavin-dependent oxidoreductase [unclassified Streptomyces]AEN09819.1 Alkanesulfonate monooxygenase [Streptomyces sp. SirexAA-E]MYR64779.1 LLM class flavin-dependent oxidoreductase [Streptomyces sp. SID4939]MYS01538.1 LLM class flavin-dependent oxidoreductase [Streptomyces sp. SID4940]MYT64323.1 LLM class flavin-dependent oxidoreductase [Streptomyces sp. SID8357]MYT87136.1 LLM class flavin-dependent oxidoreductase [Streptomyces sp. SID8360]
MSDTRPPFLLHWFLPTGGDGRDPGGVTAVQGRTGAATRRPADIGYLSQVARAAEQAGFHSLLTPVGLGCVDPWILTAALTQHTDRIGFLVAFRAGFASPTLLAQQADAFRRFAGGRLRLNVVTGGDPVEQRAYGDELAHDARYARTDEVMAVLRDLLEGKRVDHDGEHLRIEGAQLTDPALQHPVPLYFGGASPAAESVAARRADVQLLWGEPPAALADRVGRLRTRAPALRYGLRLHVISRDTSAEAWAEADRILAGIDPEAVRASQERFARMDSTGQARMAALHGGSTDAAKLQVAPNLWAGIGLVREGAGTALVGSHDEVAERLHAYHRLGIDEFILSGYPHLEEAYRVGEEVAPRLRALVAKDGE